MPLVYVVVDDAKNGVYHSETKLEKYPHARVCLEDETWNFVSLRWGQHETMLYETAKPLGTFCEWSARLPCGLVVGVFDSDSVEHVENYALFMDKVNSWKERHGVDRRHRPLEVHPF